MGRLISRAALNAVLLVVLLAVPGALPAAGAPAGGVSAWHVDFNLYAGAVGPHDAAAALRWDSPGSLTGFEVDVEYAQVDFQYLRADGGFGTFVVWARIADGLVHRMHLDATQAGPDVVVKLTIGGTLAYPFVLDGQRIGAISHPVVNPTLPIRSANARASVDQLSVWSS